MWRCSPGSTPCSADGQSTIIDDDDASLDAGEGVAHVNISATGTTFDDLPFEPGKQQTMLHLDFEVSDLEAEIERAVALGVTVASHQPQDGRAHRADWSSASP
jgi:hypothetical protein